ncbi:hypothetical protein [Faecalibacterium sp. An192]|uniref:hypothetical protein n=1 Tax=Faecalibacterium sp. An192 TaxID=1965581 RepID=UPI000B38427E|nr:hypothetical protein [Faecalibacterium sp. An192]OUP26940.1 hypothetical protein B5F27_11920 [Faecalibacterium sp. An192]
MTKVEIIALAEKWEAAAQRAEARYQDSGAARHLREKEQAEDLSAALWIAANGADDHEALIGLRSALNGLAAKAHAALDALPAANRADDRTILTDLARNAISTARLYGVDSTLAPSAREKKKRQKKKQM